MSFPKSLDRMCPGRYRGRYRAELGQDQRCHDKSTQALDQLKRLLDMRSGSHYWKDPARRTRRIKYWDAQRFRWDKKRKAVQKRIRAINKGSL